MITRPVSPKDKEWASEGVAKAIEKEKANHEGRRTGLLETEQELD